MKGSIKLFASTMHIFLHNDKVTWGSAKYHNNTNEVDTL